MRLHLNSTARFVITAAITYSAWTVCRGYASGGGTGSAGASGTGRPSAPAATQPASQAGIIANNTTVSASTNGLSPRATNGSTSGGGRRWTSGAAGVGTSITNGTNYFTPSGPEGYYTLGTNGGYLRGLTAFIGADSTALRMISCRTEANYTSAARTGSIIVMIRTTRGASIEMGCSIPARIPSRRPMAWILTQSVKLEIIIPTMPARKHLRGATPRENREYEHILKSARKSGRYGSRAKQVAARTVMKRHRATR